MRRRGAIENALAQFLRVYLQSWGSEHLQTFAEGESRELVATNDQTKARNFPTVPRTWRERSARKLIQLQHPDAVTFACPNCGEGVLNFSIPIHFGTDWTWVPFHCPACQSVLYVSSTYRWSVLGGLTALALVVPSVLQISSWYLWLGAAILSWSGLALLASVYVKVIFPPRILKYDGPDISDDPNDLPINPWRKR